MDLLKLAVRGDLDGVKTLIRRGVRVNTANRNNQTALYYACEHGRTKVARYLLDCGASVNLGAKPLIAAIRYEHYDCVKLLLERHANVNCTNMKGETPMSVAIQRRQYGTILLLLQCGAIICPSLRELAFVLVQVAKFKHAEEITKLIENNIIDMTSENVFLAVFAYAFKRGVAKIAHEMLLNDNYTKMEQLYPVAAFYSARHNWSSALLTLFEKQINVNTRTKGRTPLYVACKEGHESVVNLLLDNGADPNVPNEIPRSKELQLPIQIATQKGNVAIFNMLVGKGATLHQLREPLLHIVSSDVSLCLRSGETPLSMIRLLLEHGVTVNSTSDKGDTALYRACKSQQLEVVQALLEAGADVNKTTRCLYPFIAACETGNAEIFNLLLNAGVSVNCKNSKDETCLLVLVSSYTLDSQNVTGSVISWNVVSAIKSLLQHGADVNARCSQKETALYRACKAGSEEVVRMLLEAGAHTRGTRSRRPLYAACEHGHTQIVDLLLQHGADSNKISTASSLQVPIHIRLQLSFAEPARASLPICCAIKKGYTGITNLLLKHGADVNKQESCGKSALIYVIDLLTSPAHHVTNPLPEKPDCDVLKSMLLAGGDANLTSACDGRNPLHVASSCGRCDIIEELIQHGADCNLPTDNGNSAVDLACEKGHDAAVELLVKNGAKPDIKDIREISESDSHVANYHASYVSPECARPALCTAAKNSNEHIIKMLLNYGADVNILCQKGNTALHLTKSSTIMEALLKAGANVNVVNKRGKTALSKVCSKPHASRNVVEMLLKFGADSNIQFPLHDACENNNIDVVRLLLTYGADANVLKHSTSYSVLFGIDYRTISMRQTLLVDSAKHSVLCIACKKRNVPMVDCLLKNGASVVSDDTDSSNIPLHFAIEGLEKQTNVEEHDPIVTLLLQHNAPVNVFSDKGETPLYLACSKGLEGVVKQLLDSKADVNLTHIHADGDLSDSAMNNPLLAACRGKFRDIAMTLLSNGANTNVSANEQTPLKVAVSNGDVELVNELLSHGADANLTHDSTALHLAVVPNKYHVNIDNFVNIVRSLLTNGAEPNALNSKRETPLYLVCSQLKQTNDINLEIVQALLEHRADPNMCPPSDDSPAWVRDYVLPPLTAAAKCNNTGLMKLLVKYQARLDHKDEQGRTVLHHAIGFDDIRFTRSVELSLNTSMSNTSAVEILLSAGADFNALDNTGASPLYLACKGGKVEFVKLLLSWKASPNVTGQGKHPIHAACQSLCYDAVKLLFEYNVDVCVRDKHGRTALHHVLEAESHYCTHTEKKSVLVQLLLGETEVDINAASADGTTPLYVACSKGLSSVVEKMLDCGAKVNADTGQKLPLNAACISKNLAIVQTLLIRGANPNPNVLEMGKDWYGSTLPLVIAASDGSSEIVELLLKHGANVNAADADGSTALHHTVRKNCVSTSSGYSSKVTSTDKKKQVIDILLENSADSNVINNSGETSLYIAASKGLLDVISKMLGTYGGNPNKASSVKNPLTAACEINNLQAVDMLLKYGAEPNVESVSCEQNSRDELPLCVAVEKGCVEIMESLLKAGAMVNAMSSKGKNSLCLAIENMRGYLSTELKRIRLLLEYGADVNSLMPDGRSLLYYLVARPKECSNESLIEVIQLFVKFGATLNDFLCYLPQNISNQSRNIQTLRALAAFDEKHAFIVDLFRAGTGFQFLGFCCNAVAKQSAVVTSIRLCQAAIVAGYKPSAEELQDLQQEVAGQRDVGGLMKQLLDWLNDDRQQVPSLQRQCRIAIRRQLSTAANFRTILPAIEKLPLPADLQLYLQFDGPMTDIDFTVKHVLQTSCKTSIEQTSYQNSILSTLLDSDDNDDGLPHVIIDNYNYRYI